MVSNTNAGQCRTLKSPAEMSKDLLTRDVEHLANFDGIKSAGATIVPQNYVPKNARIVQLEKSEEAQRHVSEDDLKLTGQFISSKARSIQKGVSDT